MINLAIYLAIGCAVGFLSGMLGVGGGILIIVLLNALYSMQDFAPGHAFYLILGTSMASIMFSTFSSFRVHSSKGSVDWPVFRQILPSVIIATIVGTMLSTRVPLTLLKGFFSVFLIYVGLMLFFNYKPKAERSFPGPAGVSVLGAVTGCLSGMMGIAGGNIFIPAALWFNMPMRQAVGTAAGVGAVIALVGAVGFWWQGHDVAGLPAWSFGYIYLPALVCIIATSIICARLGALLSNRMPILTLKRCYAVFLVLSALRMGWGVLH